MLGCILNHLLYKDQHFLTYLEGPYPGRPLSVLIRDSDPALVILLYKCSSVKVIIIIRNKFELKQAQTRHISTNERKLKFIISTFPREHRAFFIQVFQVSVKLGRIVVFMIRIGLETNCYDHCRIANRIRIIQRSFESPRIIIRLDICLRRIETK